MDNETALTMLEHAIDYLEQLPADNCNALAVVTLNQSWLSIGPLGQIPSWEEN